MERKKKRITDETAANEGGADDEGDGDSTPGKIPMSEAVGLFQKLLALKRQQAASTQEGEAASDLRSSDSGSGVSDGGSSLVTRACDGLTAMR